MPKTRSIHSTLFQYTTLTLTLAALAAFMVSLSGRPAPASAASVQNLKDISDAYIELAAKASPAVVFIHSEKIVRGQRPQRNDPFDLFPRDLLERFFGPDRLPQQPQQPQRRQRPQQPEPPERFVPTAMGTGFIISSDGYIVTNNHVIAGADKVRVTLLDGQEFEGEVVGSDRFTDTAIIKIDETGLPTLPLGDSDELRVGEWVLAIGNPFGLSHTVTSGIVSAKGRSNVGVTDWVDFIQTDAAINPGNSGGPLLNLDGEVVGMNTALYSRSGGYMGIGFAIPVNIIKSVKDQLIDGGKVTRGFLGVIIQDITEEIAEWFDIEEGEGALIADVAEGSPAEKGGLKRDDIIVELNGKEVESSTDLRNRIAMVQPGQEAEMAVLRDGRKITLEVTLGERDEESQVADQPDNEYEELGVVIENLNDELAQRFGYERSFGVIVTQVAPNSLAARAGIRPGALIQEVNRRPVRNTREFGEAMRQRRGGTILLLVREGRSRRYITLRLPR